MDWLKKLSDNEIVEVFEKLTTELDDHKFDYTECDTGVEKCRHKDHFEYSASCWRARVNQFLEDATGKSDGTH